MESFELTFRFDDENNSLTRFNGLPIDLFAIFLKSLSEAVSIKNSNDLVVSEIKGNCYAPVLSTNSVTKFAEIKVLHEAISKNSFENLTIRQRNYAKSLKNVLGHKYYLDVYDKDKIYYKQIKQIIIVERVKYYYESTAIRGTVTRIGGKTLDSKPKILISKYESDIEISNEQDEALKEFYKNGILEFYIVQKINSETHHIESAILENFVIINTQVGFVNTIYNLRSQYGSTISEYLNNLEHD